RGRRRAGPRDRDVLLVQHRLPLVQPDRLRRVHRLQRGPAGGPAAARPRRPGPRRMSTEPVIAFGQQPCGFFPRRFLVAKIRTARRLQAQIGGRVVYFCHDSDHDPRETRTILRHRTTGELAHLNFAVGSKVQRKFSPLYAKRIAPDWHAHTLAQLPNYVEGALTAIFRDTTAETVADFCLAMYRRMTLLDGIEVVRSRAP